MFVSVCFVAAGVLLLVFRVKILGYVRRRTTTEPFTKDVFIRSDIDAQIVRYTELLEAKDKSNHVVADSLRQFPRTQHNITHTTTHGEGGHNKRDRENKGREKRKNTCFLVFFLHVMAVVPLTFHNVSNFLLLDAVSSTVPHVDVTQPVEKCSKLQREAKNRHCGRSHNTQHNTHHRPHHKRTHTHNIEQRLLFAPTTRNTTLNRFFHKGS